MRFDPISYHKNFNMGDEIDVAGIFIYEGIKQLGKIEMFSVESEVFYFLYNTSVGIERLQKILLVLLENINYDNYKSFEKSLRTHNHHSLNDRIKRKCDICFSERENRFIDVLDKFYFKCRYGRFVLFNDEDTEIEIINDYIQESFGDNIEIRLSLFDNKIINSNEIKDYFGRVIGGLAKKLYNKIEDVSRKLNIFTYELRTDSPAQKLFQSSFNHDSFHMQNIDESIALKELFVFLINNECENSFTRFIKTIKPLDIDLGLLNYYFEEICKGNIPTSLIDEIGELYNELEDKEERFNIISLIGNTNAIFGHNEIEQCYKLIKDFVVNGGNCKDFAKQFIEKYELIDDWEIVEALEQSYNICVEYLKDSIEHDDFIISIKNEFNEFEKLFNYEPETPAWE